MTETPDYVICLKCFVHNPPGEDFCRNCGAYLPFEGMPGEDTTSATEDAKAQRTAVGDGRPEPPAVAAGDTAGDPAAAAGDPDHPPPGDAPATEKGPVLRKPAAAAAPRSRAPAVPIPVEPAPAPDDVICPACHTPNRPERRLCRRCGTQLSSSPSAVASTQPSAGARPRGRSTRFPFTAVFVLLVLIGVVVIAWLNRDAVIGFAETILGFVFSSQSP